MDILFVLSVKRANNQTKIPYSLNKGISENLSSPSIRRWLREPLSLRIDLNGLIIPSTWNLQR